MQINNFEKFIAKINSGKCASGMVITLNDPAVSELAGDAGFDFTWIDMEHSPMTIKDVADHVMALRGTNCAPLVRVTGNSTALIKPVVDLAPAGIIIPMVKTADELESAVADCRYPPEGTRGCGLRRAIHYGAKSTETYFAESEREPLIIAQIEHIDAVRNLDAILKVKHLGSICIGPYDLSGSMNKFASPDDPEVGKVVDEICEKAHRAGIPVGAFVSDVEKWRKRNLNWAALTTDYGALFRNCTQLINQFNEK